MSLFIDEPGATSESFRTETYHVTQLTDDVINEIARLTAMCFPNSPMTLEQRVEALMASRHSDHPEHSNGTRLVIWTGGGRAIGHAHTFIRRIRVGDRELDVLALAAVCVDPDYRGLGWGAELCRRAFERLYDNAMPDVCLFQTPVPDFYQRLDCRLVENRFFNSQDPDDPTSSPWVDPWAMIYPAHFDWPSDDVDLCGPAY